MLEAIDENETNLNKIKKLFNIKIAYEKLLDSDDVAMIDNEIKQLQKETENFEHIGD